MRLRVDLHGVQVGFVDVASDRSVFRFSRSYLSRADRPVLGRFYEDHLEPDFVDRGTQGGLPSFFQNYLPEPGSAMRELLARRAGVSPGKEALLLAALGDDLPGAVVVRAVADEEDEEDPTVTSGPAPWMPRSDDAPSGPLRFSLAGVQLKFSVLREEKITVPATGVGGRFILKLPDRTFARVPANEFSMMTWARHGGVEVPLVEVVKWRDVGGLPEELAFDEPDALLVQRFDRPASGGARIHQEDFAQVLNVRPTEKYGREANVTFDRMGRVIRSVCGEADFEEFVRRLVFTILACNPDAHLKNWSLWYPDGRRPRLSPAYDLVSTCGYVQVARELACRLGDEWDLRKIRSWHFGKLAARAGVDVQRGVDLANAAAQAFRDSWKSLGRGLPLGESERSALERHLDDTKLPD